jgi:NADPH-dependent FMN reductase
VSVAADVASTGTAMTKTLTIVGLGGSLAKTSRSRAALQVALEGAAAAGAETTLLDLRELACAVAGGVFGSVRHEVVGGRSPQKRGVQRNWLPGPMPYLSSSQRMSSRMVSVGCSSLVCDLVDREAGLGEERLVGPLYRSGTSRHPSIEVLGKAPRIS